MKVMCVFGCLKLDWSFTTCVAVGWMLPGISCLKNVVLSSLEINELCWIVWYGNVCGFEIAVKLTMCFLRNTFVGDNSRCLNIPFKIVVRVPNCAEA